MKVVFSGTRVQVWRCISLRTSFSLWSIYGALRDKPGGCAHRKVNKVLRVRVLPLYWIVSTHFHNRAHVCCVSDVFGAHGMERNIGDQLNKAFEAYRQVSIEKENAKKQLQQMVNKTNKQKKKKKGQEEEMWQTWVTNSQIHSFYKVNIQLLFLFLRRLNIMSDTLRSSRSRSRTSSSWFHNSRRSCWRPGSRQVGERPSALRSRWRWTVTRCLASSRLGSRFSTWHNCCGLSLFWPLRRHEVRVPQPSIQWGQRIQKNAVPGMCRICCMCSEIAIWGSKKPKKCVLGFKTREQQWAWAQLPLKCSQKRCLTCNIEYGYCCCWWRYTLVSIDLVR